MTIRPIVTLPDPVLRRKARPVTRFDADLQTLVDDMIDTMREAPGVGLAAPQIGVSDSVIVVEYIEDEEDEDAPKKLYVMVNPEIKKCSEETDLGTEGCLSVPGWQGAAVAYAGYRRGQDPDILRVYPSQAEVAEDLKILDKHFKFLRLYGADQHAADDGPARLELPERDHLLLDRRRPEPPGQLAGL